MPHASSHILDALALIRDLAADVGLGGVAAPDLAPILAAMEAASPGATARLRVTLGARLQARGAAAVAAGAVQ